jgi:glycosyltransferase involved in cell wall biosynthesis
MTNVISQTQQPRLPVSVFYIASQEADRITESLASVQEWVSEIVVVVGDEMDPTAKVARCHGARVLANPWRGYGPQKRFAEEQCRERWLFNLDADEVVSPQLREQLTALFSNGKPELDAYRMPIRFRFAFESRPHRWAYYNSPPRLYDRQKARFRDHPVHDSVIPLDSSQPWRVGWIRGDIYHCSFRSLTHFIEKLNYYSDMQAQSLHAAGRSPWTIRVLLEPFVAFAKCYFARRYFLHGAHGITYAALWAVMRMARLAKARELAKLEAHRQCHRRA